jgi:hypothetical protein
MKKKQLLSGEGLAEFVVAHLAQWGADKSTFLVDWMSRQIKATMSKPIDDRRLEVFALCYTVSPIIDPRELGLDPESDADVKVQRRVKKLKTDFLNEVVQKLLAVVDDGTGDEIAQAIVDLSRVGAFLQHLIVHGLMEKAGKTDHCMGHNLCQLAIRYMGAIGALESPEAQEMLAKLEAQFIGQLLLMLEKAIRKGDKELALSLLETIRQQYETGVDPEALPFFVSK